jgi:hypothetical protein
MVIQQLFADKNLFENEKSLLAIAYFYFDFGNKETQSVEIALRRIVLQLSAQSQDPYRSLDEHCKSSAGQRLPSYKDLQKILHQLLQELNRTYIVLDALDECDNDLKLVELVTTLRAWTETPLHLLITSQTRQIFTEHFEDVTRLPLEPNVLQADIIFFVDSELKTNPELETWRDHAEKIRNRIACKSKGM